MHQQPKGEPTSPQIPCHLLPNQDSKPLSSPRQRSDPQPSRSDRTSIQASRLPFALAVRAADSIMEYTAPAITILGLKGASLAFPRRLTPQMTSARNWMTRRIYRITSCVRMYGPNCNASRTENLKYCTIANKAYCSTYPIAFLHASDRPLAGTRYGSGPSVQTVPAGRQACGLSCAVICVLDSFCP